MGWFHNYAVQRTDGLMTQINKIRSSYPYSEADIAIMPDAHVGKGTCIGFTARTKKTLSPFAIGVDIGCAVSGIIFEDIPWNDAMAEKLQKVIQKHIPSNNGIRQVESDWAPEIFDSRSINWTKTWKEFDDNQRDRCRKSIGTLGSGNHFIEFGKVNESNRYMLTIHTGSRCFGNYIAQKYQKLAVEKMKKAGKEYFQKSFKFYRDIYVQNHMYDKIPEKKEEILKEVQYLYPIDEMAYFTNNDEYFMDYFLDVRNAMMFSECNHLAIADDIMDQMDWREYRTDEDRIFTQHNFIERDMINSSYWFVRKGAIHVHGQRPALIPMNMKDGVLLVYPVQGGNIQWNFSAPHGTGRCMSRKQAKETLTLDSFQEEMEGISSWSVKNSTLDEAPAAYHNSNDVIKAMLPTVEVREIYRPLFNFKAS